jgi:small subunit ribosomal protein S3
LGITEGWRSQWYAGKKNFGLLLVEDRKIRGHVKKEYGFVGIPTIEIDRTGEEVTVILHTARPGLLIGRKGTGIDKLREELEKITGRRVNIKVKEVNLPELNAQLVAEGIGEQLQRRAAFRRTIRKAADTTISAGADGIKIQISGRLGGAEIARTESVIKGKIPLHTLNANIKYGLHTAVTTYGSIGVKVWVYTEKRPEKEETTNAVNA